MAARTAEVIFVGDAASLIKASKEAAAATDAAAAKIEGSNRRVAASSEATARASKSASKVGRDAAAAVAAVVVGSAALAVKLEKATAGVAAAGGTSVAAASKITSSFKHMAEGENSARMVAEAYSTVAGELKNVEGHALNASEALKVMNAAERLSLATGEDLKSSTEALGKVMLTYGIHAEGAGAASDILFNASKATGSQLGTLAQTVDRIRGKLGALAPTLGESAGLMDDLAKHGLSGRLAMGALSGTFNTLLGGGKSVAAMAKQLGLNIYDSHGKFVGLSSVIKQLQPRLAGLTQQSQLQATKALFGASANKQLLSIILQGPHAFNAATAAMSKHGTAASAAKKQSETLEGEWRKEKATAENLGGSLGKVLVPAMRAATSAIMDSVDWLKRHEAAAIALGAVIGGVLGLAISVYAYTKATKFVKATQDMIGAVKTLAAKIAGSSAVVETSFAAQATAAEAGATATAAAQDGLATDIAAKDAAIVTANEEAGASFTAMLGPIAAVVAAVVAAQPLINKLTGGGISGEHNAAAHNSFGTAGFGLQSSGGKADKIARFLQERGGLPAATAAGITKILGAESGLSTTNAGSEGAYGIAQWLGSRLSGLRKFAGRHGTSGNSLETQLEYLLHELHGPEKGTLSKLMKASSVGAAEKVFVENFERPAKSNYGAIYRRAKTYHISYGGKHIGYNAAGGPVEEGIVHAHYHTPQHGHPTRTSGTGTVQTLEQEHEAASKVKKAAAKAKAHLLSPQQIVAWAEQHVGKFAESTGKNTGPELDKLQGEFHTRAAAWCAEFATTAAMMGGANKAIRTASVATIRQWAEEGSHGYRKGVSHTPHVGDMMMFGNSHVGFVRSVNGSKVTTIEGNTSSGKVAIKTHGVGEGDYASPIYRKSATGAGALKELTAGYATAAKEAAKKLAADAKQGQSQLSKILAAVHSGKLENLTQVVGASHDKWLARLEAKLSGDHTSKLTDLSGKLVAAHSKSLAAMQQALARAWHETVATIRSKMTELVSEAGKAWKAIQQGVIEAAHNAKIKALESGPLSGALKKQHEEDEAEQARQTEESNKKALEDAQKHVREAKGNENPEELKTAEEELRHAEEAITHFKREQDEKREETQLEQERKGIDQAQEIELESLDARQAQYEAMLTGQLAALGSQLEKGEIAYEAYAARVNAILASVGIAYTPEGPGPTPAPPVIVKETKQPTSRHRASGGSVYSPPYWVGEVGPELFTPGVAGTITPASRSRAAAGATGVAGGPSVLFTGPVTMGSRRDADRLAQQLAHKLAYGGR